MESEIKNQNLSEKKINQSNNYYNNKNNKNSNIPKLKLIKSINAHNSPINSLSQFPSGNIISVSSDKSIKIYDINYIIIQIIQNAHNDFITHVDVKNENNFVTCSLKIIITWIKNENVFKINKRINNAHNDYINKVIYYLNDYLISCSCDNSIKIWEEKEMNYQLIISLKHSHIVYSILVINNKNLLISVGYDNIKLWNLNNFELIKHFEETECFTLSKIDDDRIIINKGKSFKIISLSEKKIINEIIIPFWCLGMSSIKKIGVFLAGGTNNYIKIYKNDNYELIQTIKDAHNDYINGFINLKNDLIASFSYDGKIKIWKF